MLHIEEEYIARITEGFYLLDIEKIYLIGKGQKITGFSNKMKVVKITFGGV